MLFSLCSSAWPKSRSSVGRSVRNRDPCSWREDCLIEKFTWQRTRCRNPASIRRTLLQFGPRAFHEPGCHDCNAQKEALSHPQRCNHSTYVRNTLLRYVRSERPPSHAGSNVADLHLIARHVGLRHPDCAKENFSCTAVIGQKGYCFGAWLRRNSAIRDCKPRSGMSERSCCASFRLKWYSSGIAPER